MYKMGPLTITIGSSAQYHADAVVNSTITSSSLPGVTDSVKLGFGNWEITPSSAVGRFSGETVINGEELPRSYDVKGTTSIKGVGSQVETEVNFTATDLASGDKRIYKLAGTAKALPSSPEEAEIEVFENDIKASQFKIVQTTDTTWGIKQAAGLTDATYVYRESLEEGSRITVEFPKDVTNQDVLNSLAAFVITSSGGSLASFNREVFQQLTAQFAVTLAIPTLLRKTGTP